MSRTRQTKMPFGEALAEFKRERGLTFRDLHEATQAADPSGRGLSGTHIYRRVLLKDISDAASPDSSYR